MTGETGSSEATAVIAAGVRAELYPALVASAAFAAVTLFCGWRFSGLVDPALLLPLLVAMWVPPLGVGVLAGLYFLRRPGDAVQVRIFRPIGRALRLLANLAVIVSPWILLPPADTQLRALMLMLYVWFLATQIFANHDSGGLTWLGLAGVPLSLAMWLLHAQVTYALPLAVFMLLVGVTLYGLDRLLRHNRMKAEAANLVSSGEAAALREMLAERDAQPFAAGHRDPLTPRQIEVARLLAQGLSNKEIAQQLAVSPATIKAHVAQVIAVTGARNRTGASTRAQAMGLL